MKLRALAIALLAAVVMIGWWLFANSAERQIRAIFGAVASQLRKDGQETPVTELAKAGSLARHVGTRLRIEGIGGRHELTLDHADLPQKIALFRRELQTFSVTFDQLTIKVADDGTAQAFCNATCSNMPEWIDAARAYALTATLDKSSGDWQFVALHFVPYAN